MVITAAQWLAKADAMEARLLRCPTPGLEAELIQIVSYWRDLAGIAAARELKAQADAQEQHRRIQENSAPAIPAKGRAPVPGNASAALTTRECLAQAARMDDRARKSRNIRERISFTELANGWRDIGHQAAGRTP